MQTLAHVADPFCQLGFHKHVDILRFHIDGESAAFDIRENPFQTDTDGLAVGIGDDALRRQHRRVRERAFDILLIHFGIEMNR